MAKRPTIDSVNTALSKWKTRLKRAVTAIDKLEKQKRRLEKKASVPARVYAKIVDETIRPHRPVKPGIVAVPPRPRGQADLANLGETLGPAIRESAQDAGLIPKDQPAPADLSIPSYLRRTPDPIAEQIKEEQAATKKAKARGRIDKLKAKKSGETKKMPLTGKAALDHIRNG